MHSSTSSLHAGRAKRPGRAIRLAAWLCFTGLPAAAIAQRFDAHAPPAPQPAAEAVAIDAASASRFDLAGTDPQRRYRIRAVAVGSAPPGGYPVIYLLDGNASFAALASAGKAAALPGPVLIVAVGYRTDAYFDTDARSLDYTPPLPDGQPAFDPRVPDRRGGGAEGFLDFIQHTLKPAVAARWKIDQRRQAIWGHSYGGLLVLHALFTRQGMFSDYIAASPSLWWHAPLMQNEAQAFVVRGGIHGKRLWLMAGDSEMRPAGHAASPAPAAITLQQLAESLHPVHGLAVSLRIFPQAGHGQVFSASLGPAIRDFLGGRMDTR